MAEEGAPSGREYKGKVNETIIRKYQDELKYIKRVSPWKFEISQGFVQDMKVIGTFYVNESLEELILDELRAHCSSGGVGGFLPAVKQIANVAALPGIVNKSIGELFLYLLAMSHDLSIRSSRRSLRLWICNWQCCCIRYGGSRSHRVSR
jgi:hypothetical protein